MNTNAFPFFHQIIIIIIIIYHFQIFLCNYDPTTTTPFTKSPIRPRIHSYTLSSPLIPPWSDDPMPNIFSLNGDGFLDARQIISIS